MQNLPQQISQATVRSLVTLAFMGLFVGAFFAGDASDIPEWLRTLGIATIAFWFADREPAAPAGKE